MNRKQLEAFAKAAAKSLKTEKDLSSFSRMLKEIIVETALNGAIDDHLSYEKHQSNDNSNSRNGQSSKALYTDDGPFNIDVSQDRDSSFEPQLVKQQADPTNQHG
jgi:putative transposase